MRLPGVLARMFETDLDVLLVPAALMFALQAPENSARRGANVRKSCRSGKYNFAS